MLRRLCQGHSFMTTDLKTWYAMPWPAVDYSGGELATIPAFPRQTQSEDKEPMKKHVPTGLKTPKKQLLSIIKHLEETLGDLATKKSRDVERPPTTPDPAPLHVVHAERLSHVAEAAPTKGVPDGPSVTFGPGASSKRSAGMAPFFQIPLEIMRELAWRYFVGRKYGINNWKRAAEDKDVGFIRQALNHDFDHSESYVNFFQNNGLEKRVTAMLSNAGLSGERDEQAVPHVLPTTVLRSHLRSFRGSDGETRFGHAIARVWNSIALAWYEYHYPELTALAFYNDWRGEREEGAGNLSTRQ